MRFLAGFITAFAVIALGAAITILSGIYNVAATVPASGLEHLVLRSVMVEPMREMKCKRNGMRQRSETDFVNMARCA